MRGGNETLVRAGEAMKENTCGCSDSDSADRETPPAADGGRYTSNPRWPPEGGRYRSIVAGYSLDSGKLGRGARGAADDCLPGGIGGSVLCSSRPPQIILPAGGGGHGGSRTLTAC